MTDRGQVERVELWRFTNAPLTLGLNAWQQVRVGTRERLVDKIASGEVEVRTFIDAEQVAGAAEARAEALLHGAGPDFDQPQEDSYTPSPEERAQAAALRDFAALIRGSQEGQTNE